MNNTHFCREITHFCREICNMIFRKWGGGQRQLDFFPKIHSFWWCHLSLYEASICPFMKLPSVPLWGVEQLKYISGVYTVKMAEFTSVWYSERRKRFLLMFSWKITKRLTASIYELLCEKIFTLFNQKLLIHFQRLDIIISCYFTRVNY